MPEKRFKEVQHQQLVLMDVNIQLEKQQMHKFSCCRKSSWVRMLKLVADFIIFRSMSTWLSYIPLGLPFNLGDDHLTLEISKMLYFDTCDFS